MIGPGYSLVVTAPHEVLGLDIPVHHSFGVEIPGQNCCLICFLGPCFLDKAQKLPLLEPHAACATASRLLALHVKMHCAWKSLALQGLLFRVAVRLFPCSVATKAGLIVPQGLKD